MSDIFKLTESDQDFEKKVSVIADEVLSILKELHQENRQQISSKLIAEKMVWKTSVKDILTINERTKTDDGFDSESLKIISDALLDKLKILLPPSMTDALNALKDDIHNKSKNHSSKDLLESPINIIKKHIDSIASRNRELEEFMVVAMRNLSNTESHFTSELSSHHDKFSEDRIFEERISENMNMMSEDINISGDIHSIKSALMNKIENINTRISDKRAQDMHKLKETEKTLEDMSTRLSEIKEEADEIRKRSQEIEFEAMRDALTGLHNRKGYDEKLSETLAHVNRYHIKSSFIICDIDFFKQINDNFGHKVGDLALKKLALLLKQRLRTSDFIARFGGEEFVIILPHTDLEGASVAGNGLREFIDNAAFSYQGKQIPLTISVGVSEFKKDDDHSSVFERADNALYLAKNSGRNTVRTEIDVINSEVVIENTN
jgi:diguanylate cyclase